MATHSSILAWKIPWTEEPDGLQSIGSQKLDKTEWQEGGKSYNHLFALFPLKLHVPLLVANF